MARKRKPMQVYVKPGTNVKAQQAVRAMNEMVGKKVLRITHNRARADVVIRTGPAATGHSAQAIVGGKPKWNTRILIPERTQEARPSFNKFTVAHELGHALGFNDRFTNKGKPNLMSYPEPTWALSPGQRRRVKANYRAQSKMFKNG